MSNIWFTSDTHYHHKNIVRGASEWQDANAQNTRDFATLEEHDAKLVENINKHVKKDDILYHLGDWSFGGKEFIAEFAQFIACDNIHLIYGNHDHHIERNRDGFQRFFRSVQHYTRREIGGQDMVLCHYAMRTWDKGHHGSWMLFGHSHGTLPNYGTSVIIPASHSVKVSHPEMPPKLYKTMDVGIDTHPEFRPYHLDELKKIMKERVSLRVDHHNEETN